MFVYTTCQEKATQVSHLNTGKLAVHEEPLLDTITQKTAQDESRNYAFYVNVFREILQRDPNNALEAASSIMPSIDMPGISIVNFNDYADVEVVDEERAVRLARETLIEDQGRDSLRMLLTS